MAGWDDMVLVGRIARPHGVRGQVIVSPETDFVDERFVSGATMWVRRAVYNVVTTVTVSEEYPGILCAKLVTRDGAAIDCWRKEPEPAGPPPQ